MILLYDTSSIESRFLFSACLGTLVDNEGESDIGPIYFEIYNLWYHIW